MKYLAILKDSFREAIDSKVLYVTVGLSLLLTLLVVSISFRPVPADEALQTIVNQFRLVYPDRGRSVMARYFFNAEYQVKDVQRLNEAGAPQEGDYRLTLDVTKSEFRKAVAFWMVPPASEAPEKEDSTEVPLQAMEEFVKEQFVLFGGVEVTGVTPLPSTDSSTLSFAVNTKGTKGVRGWLHDPCLFFGAVPMKFLRGTLGFWVYWIEDKLVNGIGAWIGILAGVVITAFFIPNMLSKGTVDLLLVKPIHRGTLLIYKYLGGLAFIVLNATAVVFGLWLALGLRSGIWAPGFLLTIPVLTFFFAILYAVSTLFGVLTRSPIVAILVTCAVWFFLWLVGFLYTQLSAVRDEPGVRKEIPNWVYTTVDTLHLVLPRTKDLDILTTQLLSREVLPENEIRQQKIDRLPSLTWTESLSVSGIFIALTLGLACWRFATKDY